MWVYIKVNRTKGLINTIEQFYRALQFVMEMKFCSPEKHKRTLQYTSNVTKAEKINELNDFIFKSQDVRECKRAEAVKLRLLGLNYQEIANKLGVSISFIAKVQRQYTARGIDGIKLKYKGSKGYLTPTQQAEIVHWINHPEHRKLSALKRHLKDDYDVVFKSKESYYKILRESQFGWRQGNKPKKHKN
ncbi:MAG: helix-turn-helix domain-containing protein [Coleofasciculus sp. C1-SOL-03]|jgi:transposase|uniref:helix-turn-helix domain-containing protein n=1 Tax=Coleofasciculus sp. C1-SOL-03 TaxID=3069522 RepID=UPI003304FCC6